MSKTRKNAIRIVGMCDRCGNEPRQLFWVKALALDFCHQCYVMEVGHEPTQSSDRGEGG